MTDAAVLARRLDRLRAERDRRGEPRPADVGQADIREAIARLQTSFELADVARRPSRESSLDLAERLASAVDGEVVIGPDGCHVRRDLPSIHLPVDRRRLARLPGSVPAEPPLVCIDTETTGLATATGTMVFVVGLGWWEGDRFRQVALVLPDQSEERSLLGALGASIPDPAWLVSYNGRSFDWPLLTTRYRMIRRPAPAHAGHFDLLPFVRRVLRHRLPDARLGTVERELLEVHRDHDVGGWEIPGIYLAFLGGGPTEPLADVIRHNDEDVRSLGRLLAHIERAYGDLPGGLPPGPLPHGDLAGLARAYRTEGRHEDALVCFDAAIACANAASAVERGHRAAEIRRWGTEELPYGARPWERWTARPADVETLRAERARLLRRLGRHGEQLDAWHDLASAGGPLAALAWIEIAKLHEHWVRDPREALAAVRMAARYTERERQLGRPRPWLEADIARRLARLSGRLARREDRSRAS